MTNLAGAGSLKLARTNDVPVYVVGVGMTKFEKPGSRDWDYPDMAKEAGTKALARRLGRRV